MVGSWNMIRNFYDFHFVYKYQIKNIFLSLIISLLSLDIWLWKLIFMVKLHYLDYICLSYQTFTSEIFIFVDLWSITKIILTYTLTVYSHFLFIFYLFTEWDPMIFCTMCYQKLWIKSHNKNSPICYGDFHTCKVNCKTYL